MKQTLLLFLFAAGSAHAAITPISAVTTTPPVDNQFGISALIIGATTHTTIINGTVSGWATTPDGNVFHHLGPANAAGAPADRETAIGDNFISTGVYNDDLLIDFGWNLNDGDTTPIFIIERGNGGDSATIYPLVGGMVDTSWSIRLSAGTDFGNLAGTDVSWSGSATTMSGTSFTLADFTGGAGNLTNVTGIQIIANGLDTAMAGVLPAPEVVPGSLQFSAASYAGAYDSGGITVTVARAGGSAGAVSVAYATGDGSARAGPITPRPAARSIGMRVSMVPKRCSSRCATIPTARGSSFRLSSPARRAGRLWEARRARPFISTVRWLACGRTSFFSLWMTWGSTTSVRIVIPWRIPILPPGRCRSATVQATIRCRSQTRRAA